MMGKLLRSIIIGIIIALVLLVFIPALRNGGGLFISSNKENNASFPFSFNQAVRKAAPAVVNVYSRSINDNNNNHQNEVAINTLGSGVIMNHNGYILTNMHVIYHANQIIIALQDGRLFEARLIGSDALTDLAVLKIDATDLPVIPINPKQQAHVGDVVLAIGNPYNIGQTITQGIISATGRNGLSPYRRQNFLQTDASINRGNSGGALINTLGELVGINTLSFAKNNQGEILEGIGLAIPTQLATNVMDKLIRDGKLVRGYIGIEGLETTPSTMQSIDNINKQQGLASSIIYKHGIIVSDVNKDGPAAQGGIMPGDIILSVNDRPAISAIEVMDQIAEMKPGTKVKVTVLRNGKLIDLPINVQEYPIN